MVVVDGEGVPLGSTITSASPAEVKLIEPLLEVTYGKTKIQRLVYDKAADSDLLRDRLAKQGIDLICPHRSNRKKPAKQDGRKLRRYTRRWKVERTFAWLGNFGVFQDSCRLFPLRGDIVCQVFFLWVQRH
ncbi:transposase [Microbulbifer thermotolerans]|uniref:transposase n=1 Tax=Microbulbifer thermotolerans TaxID=252514 RepID=UPI0034626613